MTAGFDVQVLPAEAFAQRAAEWDALNAAHVGLPVLDSTFFAGALRHFASGTERLVRCSKDGALCAMGVVRPDGWGRWSTFQPSQAPFGAWIQDARVAPETLALAVMRALPRAVSFGITQQDPLYLQRPADSSRTTTLDYIETACIHIEGEFEAYWQQRGKNLRQNVRTQHNRLARENIAPRFEVATRRDAVERGVDAYGALESRGWKGEEGTALHPDNAQGVLYREFLGGLAERGEAVVYSYFFDDRLVACELTVRRGTTLILLKTTHDETITGLSPATLMRRDILDAVFAGGVCRRFEFYGRVKDWQRRLTDDTRRMYHVTTYRSPLLRRVRQWLAKDRSNAVASNERSGP